MILNLFFIIQTDHGQPLLQVHLLLAGEGELVQKEHHLIMMIMLMMMVAIMMGCTKNPISTLSHIWVFVRLYGLVFVIIVIIIIIIMIIKSEGMNAQL